MAYGVIVDLDFPMQLIVKLDDWLGHNNNHDLPPMFILGWEGFVLKNGCL
jgi:hypothetical protein